MFRISDYKSKISKFFISLIFVIFTLITAEIFLRIFGYQSYNQITSGCMKFNNCTPFKVDSLLGYVNNAGVCQWQSECNQTIVNTILPNNNRYCGTSIKLSTKKIMLFGDSFFYGQCVSDSETVAFHLQQLLPNTTIENYATPGYSMLHSLLILQRELARGNTPDKIIIEYADLDDMRIVFSPIFADQISAVNNIPDILQFKYVFLTPSEKGYTINQKTIGSLNTSFRKKSALVELIFRTTNQIKHEQLPIRDALYYCTNQLYLLCQMHGIELEFFAITQNTATDGFLQYLHSKNITVYQSKLDISQKKNSLYPCDVHANGICQMSWAQEMASFALAH